MSSAPFLSVAQGQGGDQGLPLEAGGMWEEQGSQPGY